MTKALGYVLWLIQLAALITILVCSWLVLDRTLFALVAACVVLATSLYVERETTHGSSDHAE